MKQNKLTKNSLGMRLKAYRLERDLSFDRLAKIINKGLPATSKIRGSTLYRIENGLIKVGERTEFKIKKAIPELFNE